MRISDCSSDVCSSDLWGERNGVPVVAQGQNADAASVAFDALQAAKARGTDVLIADTAGRLHTQQGLMAELGKIKRVLGKLDPTAPHEVLMVIDGTTGQNALSQRSEEHTSELQSLMRKSYAVLCLKK